MASTDLFNEAIDDLAATLGTITGLRVITDPRYVAPNCVFIDAPSFTAFNYNIVTMDFPVSVVGMGPGDLNALRTILSICASLLAKNVAVKTGRPTQLDIGGVQLPAYDLTISMQAQTA